MHRCGPAFAAMDLGARFSWIAHLAAATLKLAKSGYDVYSARKAGVGTAAGWVTDPSPFWAQGIGSLLFGAGIVVEGATLHTDRGEAVKTIEWAMVSVTAVQLTKSVAVLVYQKRKGQPLAKAVETEAVLDIGLYIIHFVLCTAAYGAMMGDNYGKRANTPDQAERDRLQLDDAVLTVLWLEELFSHISNVLGSTAIVALNPKVKAGTLIGAVGTRAVALGLAVASVVVSGQAKRSITA